MTIETQTNRVQYVGNSLATDFPVPFPVFRPEHLRLFLWQDDRQSEMTHGFMVLGAGTVQVTVRTLAPIPSGVRLTIIRQVPLVQPMDLINGGAFNAEILEGSDDNLEMQIQQLKEEIDRAIKVPIGSNQDPDEMWLKFWAAYLETLKSRDEVLAALKMMMESGFALRPATTTSLGGVIIGDGLAVETSGRVSVDFTQMPTDKFEAMLRSIRVPIWLGANTNFYVRQDGNNANDGLANTPQRAWRTFAHALNYIASNYNFGTFNATLNIGPGEWNEILDLPKYNSTTGRFIIHGAGIAETILKSVNRSVATSRTGTGLYEIGRMSVDHQNSNQVTGVRGLFIGAGTGVELQFADLAIKIRELDVPAVSNEAIFSATDGGFIGINANVSIDINTDKTTSATYCFYLSGGRIQFARPNQVEGKCYRFIHLTGSSRFSRNNANNGRFSGNLVGNRYRATENSIVSTNGNGPGFFPGDTAGDVQSGAQYT